MSSNDSNITVLPSYGINASIIIFEASTISLPQDFTTENNSTLSLPLASKIVHPVIPKYYLYGMPPAMWAIMALLTLACTILIFYIMGGPEACSRECRNCRRRECCCDCCRIEGELEEWPIPELDSDLRAPLGNGPHHHTAGAHALFAR